MSIKKKGRHFAVLDDQGALICLAVYKKGAEELLRRLVAAEQTPKATVIATPITPAGQGA